MLRISRVFVSAIAFAPLLLVSPAYAANFSLSEPFNNPGALSSKWIATGTVPPAVVNTPGQTPANALQLTNANNDQRGFALYDRTIPVNQGLDITFTSAQWGGSGGADGIVFFVKDAADTDSEAGAGGGGLGYAPDNLVVVDGISGALLGVGLDGYGNFDEDRSDGTDCNHAEFVNYDWPDFRNTLVIRGPGTGQSGYCRLADTARLSVLGLPDLVGTSRADAARVVRVTIDPADITDSRVMVYYEDELVFDVPLPEEFDSVDGIKMGFSAGTGGETDFHDIWGLSVTSLISVDDETGEDSGGEQLAETGGADVSGLLLISGALATIAVFMRRRHSFRRR